MNPVGWDHDALDTISRDLDPEEPPPFRSGHDAFLEAEATYEGWDDLESHDE